MIGKADRRLLPLGLLLTPPLHSAGHLGPDLARSGPKLAPLGRLACNRSILCENRPLRAAGGVKMADFGPFWRRQALRASLPRMCCIPAFCSKSRLSASISSKRRVYRHFTHSFGMRRQFCYAKLHCEALRASHITCDMHPAGPPLLKICCFAAVF